MVLAAFSTKAKMETRFARDNNLQVVRLAGVDGCAVVRTARSLSNNEGRFDIRLSLIFGLN